MKGLLTILMLTGWSGIANAGTAVEQLWGEPAAAEISAPLPPPSSLAAGIDPFDIGKVYQMPAGENWAGPFAIQFRENADLQTVRGILEKEKLEAKELVAGDSGYYARIELKERSGSAAMDKEYAWMRIMRLTDFPSVSYVLVNKRLMNSPAGASGVKKAAELSSPANQAAYAAFGRYEGVRPETGGASWIRTQAITYGIRGKFNLHVYFMPTAKEEGSVPGADAFMMSPDLSLNDYQALFESVSPAALEWDGLTYSFTATARTGADGVRTVQIRQASPNAPVTREGYLTLAVRNGAIISAKMTKLHRHAMLGMKTVFEAEISGLTKTAHGLALLDYGVMGSVTDAEKIGRAVANPTPQVFGEVLGN